MSIETLARQVGQLLKVYAGDEASADRLHEILKHVTDGLTDPAEEIASLDLPVRTTGNLPTTYDVDSSHAITLILGPVALGIAPRDGLAGIVSFEIDADGKLTGMVEQPSHGGPTRYNRFRMAPCAEPIAD